MCLAILLQFNHFKVNHYEVRSIRGGSEQGPQMTKVFTAKDRAEYIAQNARDARDREEFDSFLEAADTPGSAQPNLSIPHLGPHHRCRSRRLSGWPHPDWFNEDHPGDRKAKDLLWGGGC